MPRHDKPREPPPEWIEALERGDADIDAGRTVPASVVMAELWASLSRMNLSARFRPFLLRRDDGSAEFANSVRIDQPFSVLLATPRPPARRARWVSVPHVRYTRLLERSSRLAEARRWLPENPMMARAMATEDARLARRRSGRRHRRPE